MFRFQYLPFCFFLVLLWPGMVLAVTTLTDEKIVVELGDKIHILVDTSGSLNIDQITTEEISSQFRPRRQKVPNLGFGAPVVWVRFQVKNLTFTEAWILQAAFSDMDHVELYLGENPESPALDIPNWQVQELGQDLPFTTRKIVNRNLLFNLSLPFGKTHTFFLRYQNAVGMTLPLKLFSSQQYQGHALGVQFVFGILFGFLLVLSLYNLILYLKVHEFGYLFYFLYGAGYGLFQFSLYGLAHQYFWPQMTWWTEHHIYFFLAFAIFFRILFTQSVLDTRRNAPRQHKALQGLLIAWVPLAAYFLLAAFDALPAALTLSPIAGLKVAALYFFAFTSVVLSANIRCLRKRLPAAKTFMLAWLLMVAGLTLYALKSLGVLPSNFITEYGVLAGSVGEMCLLFVSLGERIRASQETQIRSMRLELELLKANIQPHFMLNSINAAILWIQEDPKAAEKLLHALSAELKMLLNAVGEKFVTVGEEIRLCRTHLEVMSLRHDKHFEMSLEDIQPEEKIPPLVIHTLVENGLTHGYVGKERGRFVLKRSEDEKKIRYALFNDGEANPKIRGSGSGLGLKYVRARLQEAYGENWRLDSHAVEGGWLATITMVKPAIHYKVGRTYAHSHR